MTTFSFDLGAALSASMEQKFFTLFFIDFFDTAGTLTVLQMFREKLEKRKIRMKSYAFGQAHCWGP
ncbi:MAG: hypothetical protein Ct9H300mP5_1420 [Candidatus Pelagibacterales bacterium]|nr:MAG: hypothetical protein Ct9H300mP5_1420 [Pelagibacterales bacterium]